MNNLTKTHYIIFSFILAGLLFSGYLSGVKFFSDTCAFGSTCPIFLGMPACYTGFVVYFVLALIALFAVWRRNLSRSLLVSITGISLFGALFSGMLALEELSVLFSDGFMAYVKSLPLCAIGFVFYVVVFVLSLLIGGKYYDNKELPSMDGQKIEVEKQKEEIMTPEVIHDEHGIEEDKDKIA